MLQAIACPETGGNGEYGRLPSFDSHNLLKISAEGLHRVSNPARLLGETFKQALGSLGLVLNDLGRADDNGESVINIMPHSGKLPVQFLQLFDREGDGLGGQFQLHDSRQDSPGGARKQASFRQTPPRGGVGVRLGDYSMTWDARPEESQGAISTPPRSGERRRGLPVPAGIHRPRSAAVR